MDVANMDDPDRSTLIRAASQFKLHTEVLQDAGNWPLAQLKHLHLTERRKSHNTFPVPWE